MAPTLIPKVPTLTPAEQRAVARLIEAAVARGDPPLLRALLFGSKARGDFDRDSDVDVLFVYDVPTRHRDAVAAASQLLADRITEATGVALETWAVAMADLDEGCRTPMLVDALEDGLPLWPPGAPPLALPFTPADACFCAGRLLEWVEDGGPLREWALRRGHARLAARRARDDITRIATAALLLTGDTRHRRTGSLRRFHDRFVARGRIPPIVTGALRWAAAAYPRDRGREAPPPTAFAVATAPAGVRGAAVMEAEVVPWILRRMREIDGAEARRGRSRFT
ncbi:MAG TPA: nucleotidyltransferase domain-containing protein [Longimicrobiales bacterium]|nr:nucleotidyltransferase domain-containing protein [Longimicrobiales bacterium]